MGKRRVRETNSERGEGTSGVSSSRTRELAWSFPLSVWRKPKPNVTGVQCTPLQGNIKLRFSLVGEGLAPPASQNPNPHETDSRVDVGFAKSCLSLQGNINPRFSCRAGACSRRIIKPKPYVAGRREFVSRTRGAVPYRITSPRKKQPHPKARLFWYITCSTSPRRDPDPPRPGGTTVLRGFSDFPGFPLLL